MLAGVVGISGSNFGVSNFIGSLDSFETGRGESLGIRCGRRGMPLGNGFKSMAAMASMANRWPASVGGPEAKIRAFYGIVGPTL